MVASTAPSFQQRWSGRAVASSGLFCLLEVALLRALLGDTDVASRPIVLLLAAGLGFFAWSSYNSCLSPSATEDERRRPVGISSGADTAAGPPKEERHRGIVQSFSEQHGCGIIVCADEEDWPESDNVRFYLADKERLGLQTEDVIDFHIILDRQAKDGSFRAVNIRYAYDAPKRVTSSASKSQGRTDNRRTDIADIRCRDVFSEAIAEDSCVPSSCISRTDEADRRPSLPSLQDSNGYVLNGNPVVEKHEAQLLPRSTHEDANGYMLNSNPVVEKHEAQLLPRDTHEDSNGYVLNGKPVVEKHEAQLLPRSTHEERNTFREEEKQLDKTRSIADHVPSTRLGITNSHSSAEKLQNEQKVAPTLSVSEPVEVRLQDLVARKAFQDTQHAAQHHPIGHNSLASFLDLDKDRAFNNKISQTHSMAVQKESESKFNFQSFGLPHRECDVSLRNEGGASSGIAWHGFRNEGNSSNSPPLQPPEPVLLTCKNTFLHVADAASDTVHGNLRMKRSASDSDISSSSRISSSTGSAVENNRLGDRGDSRCMYWLPSLTSSSEGYSMVDGFERSDAKQERSPEVVPMPTKMPFRLASTDDCRLRCEWEPSTSQHSQQPMYVENCDFSSREGASLIAAGGRPATFLERNDLQLLQTPVNGQECFAQSSRQNPVNGQECFAQSSRADFRSDMIDSVWDSGHAGHEQFMMQLQAETGTPVAELEALRSQGILQQIPRNDEGEFTTVGSISHWSGECRACVFWFRKSCAKGVHCTFCHFVHKGQKQKRIRPSKATRLRLKSEASEVAENAPVGLVDSEREVELDG